MNYPLYNDTLCPKVWSTFGESFSMKPEVRNALLSIAKDFMEQVIDLTEKLLAYYAANAKKRERAARFVERVGIETIKQAVLG